MMDKFTEKLFVLAAWVNGNKYLCAIKDSFTSAMSLIIVGSIGTLIGSVACSPANGLAQFEAFAWMADYASMFTQVNSATTNMLALLIAYNIGYYLSKSNGFDGHFEGLVSLCAVICASPTTVTAIIGEQSTSVTALGTSVTASNGLFISMIVGIIATEAYCKLASVDKLKIKMPESVPSNVSASFSGLVPTTIVLFAISIVSFVIRSITGMYLSEIIYKVLAVPVSAAFQYPVGIILCAFIAAVFWVCGIHGASIVTGMTDAITIAACNHNADLVLAGQPATEIVTRPFWSMFITMGGFGCTISLLIAIFIASKRADDRAIAKLAIPCGCFGINEPVIFGLPIVLNPIMAIPFVITPMVSAAIGYFLTYIGFAGKAYITIPWCMPPVINGFLATGGNIGAAVAQIICIAVGVVIYLPFVMMRNKEIEKES
ncbi:MAG: PTS transporter subunit EIIC [Clostridiales bacterium]|nr:PTS transporter subunit EIIC [Clostridiales bacterium]